MGLTVVIGGKGVGKTSFIVARVKHLLRTEGKARLRKSTANIEEFNKTREIPLTAPDKVPICSNFEMEFKVGFQKTYKPYYLDEEYFGLPNMGKLVAAVAPWSIVAFQEMDDEYNSRERKVEKAVSGLFYKSRHFGLEIFMDLHRTMILDSIIREVTDVFIEIQRQEHEYNFAGQIVKTTWYCREFDKNEILRYVKSDGTEGNYRETTYEHVGNIFKCYNSRNCAKDFVPKDGEDFVYLKQRSEVDVETLPAEIAKFYEKGAKKNEPGREKTRRGSSGA